MMKNKLSLKTKSIVAGLSMLPVLPQAILANPQNTLDNNSQSKSTKKKLEIKKGAHQVMQETIKAAQKKLVEVQRQLQEINAKEKNRVIKFLLQHQNEIIQAYKQGSIHGNSFLRLNNSRLDPIILRALNLAIEQKWLHLKIIYQRKHKKEVLAVALAQDMMFNPCPNCQDVKYEITDRTFVSTETSKQQSQHDQSLLQKNNSDLKFQNVVEEVTRLLENSFTNNGWLFKLVDASDKQTSQQKIITFTLGHNLGTVEGNFNITQDFIYLRIDQNNKTISLNNDFRKEVVDFVDNIDIYKLFNKKNERKKIMDNIEDIVSDIVGLKIEKIENEMITFLDNTHKYSFFITQGINNAWEVHLAIYTRKPVKFVDYFYEDCYGITCRQVIQNLLDNISK